ncbi:hypothetical protein TSAR_004691 [Trichomalopsis sarcophagae]|uniref:Uncharacterized protein n=1 Tax=Trichomalopsis sarcophagae TaxID=543379 RepID=A0A232FFZ9_9HYME|nr:hypothetical protein TSAR_004691 [Trichomalopsis sarcophagae]
MNMLKILFLLLRITIINTNLLLYNKIHIRSIPRLKIMTTYILKEVPYPDDECRKTAQQDIEQHPQYEHIGYL